MVTRPCAGHHFGAPPSGRYVLGIPAKRQGPFSGDVGREGGVARPPPSCAAASGLPAGPGHCGGRCEAARPGTTNKNNNAAAWCVCTAPRCWTTAPRLEVLKQRVSRLVDRHVLVVVLAGERAAGEWAVCQQAAGMKGTERPRALAADKRDSGR
eukprot:358439-Chlamydomonas_euryale.AAC.4